MKNRFEFTAVVLIGNGELTDDFTIDIAKMADRLNTQLEIAKKALQTIAESSAQGNEAAKTIAAEALIAIVE
ncbi:hypothetical protein [Paenibacillus aceris]|uniref:Uncharacterized protein n=1 Tax=Paenibacillus aceris TaxID=869555 RepID=A0ABS4IAL4_9BACL|nr:hypothetical protein [Paenibacillus aceris]MBP1967119.1 hypothetical protein [Paenibacillus aceris]NHW35531.1 hypothetical protein [Paenibacillus aceris]